MKNRYTFLDKMVDYILTNAHCISTGYVGTDIECIYRMQDGTKYRIILDSEYELTNVAMVA